MFPIILKHYFDTIRKKIRFVSNLNTVLLNKLKNNKLQNDIYHIFVVQRFRARFFYCNLMTAAKKNKGYVAEMCQRPS